MAPNGNSSNGRSDRVGKALVAARAAYAPADLYSPRAIALWMSQLRRVDRAARDEIEAGAEDLAAMIAASPGVTLLFGADSRRRARLICEPLFEAANAHNAAANLSVLAWQRFNRSFGELIQRSGGRKPAKSIDWADS